MSKGFMSQMTRPEEGERGLGASHRRGGMGVASYRRPPEGLVKALVRVESPTSKAPGAERKVESMRDKGAKRAANRKLHIDDGCMGGGGDKIDHIKEFPMEWSLRKNGSNNDFFDYYLNDKYFSTDRHDIFHYSIYCDEALYHDGDTYEGLGSTPGDSFIIGKGLIDSTKREYQTFMHELGHNILGSPIYNPYAAHIGSDGHHHDADCIMRPNGKTDDYCDDCWKAINLPISFKYNRV